MSVPLYRLTLKAGKQQVQTKCETQEIGKKTNKQKNKKIGAEFPLNLQIHTLTGITLQETDIKN